jgi:hypothetical protein
MRKSRRDFKKESTRPVYELDLENPPEGGPEFVTFKDPNRLETDSAFEMARETDPEVVLRKLLSEQDYVLWWAEWRKAPINETNELLEDIQEHYGAAPGKRRS